MKQMLFFPFAAVLLLGWSATRTVAQAPLQATVAPAIEKPLHSPKQSVDLRPQFVSYGLDVRQQGQRGSCQVFGMVTVAEFLLAKRGHTVALSEQYLMWAANDACGLNRTDGFNPDLLIKGWKLHGICDEADMPYIPRNEPILPPSEHAQQAAAKRASIRFTSIKHWSSPIGFTPVHMQKIVDSLSRGIPVSVTFCWPVGLNDAQIVDKDSFLIDSHIDGTDKSGHGVALIGFTLDPDVAGGGYFLLRNSWGPKFADGGYAKITFAMALKFGTDAYIVSIR